MTRKRIWFSLAAICLAIILVAVARRQVGVSAEPQEPKLQPVSVEVATAVVGPVESTVSAQGTLTPAQGASARVATPAQGRLLEARAVEGQRVTVGQVLAVIDNRPQQYQSQLALQVARSDREHGVKEAQIALETARKRSRRPSRQ